jgi:hypothetical protein
MVIRPSLQAWRSMLYDHLAAHNAWQVVETSFLNFYFGGGQGVDAGSQPAAGSISRETTSEAVHISAGEHGTGPGIVRPAAANAHDDEGRGSPAPALHRHRWVLPLNYLCVAETAARYDSLTLCSTFDFSSCGRSRFKVRELRDPGASGDAGMMCGARRGEHRWRGSRWDTLTSLPALPTRGPIPCLPLARPPVLSLRASQPHAPLQPWQNRDPPAEDSKACRGKPPSAVFRALIAAWREAHAAVSAALATVPSE